MKNMLALKREAYEMFMAVREAAQDGRYMFGNGADWFILEKDGTKVHLNTVMMTRNVVPTYTGTAVKCETTVRTLDDFLAQYAVA
jgi:hypothetical protein